MMNAFADIVLVQQRQCLVSRTCAQPPASSSRYNAIVGVLGAPGTAKVASHEALGMPQPGLRPAMDRSGVVADPCELPSAMSIRWPSPWLIANRDVAGRRRGSGSS
ncbi:MAG: hypothetical protein KJO75_02820, partial [Dactylosporangium sp.]|nr:hypothetical protein [Dactylosporangium sp.]